MAMSVRPQAALGEVVAELETRAWPGANAQDTQDLRLGFLIHDVSRLRRNTFDQIMKPLGVTRSQWWVIAHLSREEGSNQTQLAEILDVGKVTLGGLIDRLEASGLVARKPDATDRRIRRVYLTKAAHALIKQMREAECKHNRLVLAGLTDEDRSHLSELLSKLKRNLRAMPEDIEE
jgi:MarR family transcriptional regulator for hemolysin